MLGFNRSEQRMLSCAVPGATDEQLAEALETSLSVVKKMWVSIYRRVEDCVPELVANSLPSDIPASGRGREKRRRLLAYLREHPEELRPACRSLSKRANDVFAVHARLDPGERKTPQLERKGFGLWTLTLPGVPTCPDRKKLVGTHSDPMFTGLSRLPRLVPTKKQQHQHANPLVEMHRC
jgi:hypothetical protein